MLVLPFGIAPRDDSGRNLRFSDALISYAFGQQRPISGTVSLQQGRSTTAGDCVTVSGARGPSPAGCPLEPSLSLNRVSPAVRRFHDAARQDARRLRVFNRACRKRSASVQKSADRKRSATTCGSDGNTPGQRDVRVYTDERDTRGAGFPGSGTAPRGEDEPPVSV